ncbi:MULTISPECIES: tetratricopeptide repeat protein [Streptomyces]|uniref:tetratricopeptide repeat protein n=1 Tax=Streptomyces TaxID=1883 RepID=UPI00068D23B4|nr:tetratricopeptide repeat protein [Streptomyces viridochromogenes]
MDVYGPDEAEAYVRSRLRGDGMDHLLGDRVSALAGALGRLPLALSHAAAFLINEELTCTAYLARYADRRTHLEQILPESADTEGYGYRITAALLLSLDAVEAADPAGYVVTVLRANTGALVDHANDHLWQPDAHQTLSRAGTSLIDAGLSSAATAFWQDTTRDSERLLGSDHPDTLTIRANLAVALSLEDRAEEALAIEEEVLAVRERVLGKDHPDTLLSRSNLAVIYRDAGRVTEAVPLMECVVADSRRILGDEHPCTLADRGNLAIVLRKTGRITEAIALAEQVLADREQFRSNPQDILNTRISLAISYQQAGRTTEALALEERVLADSRQPTADSRQLLGEDHPATLTARGNVVSSPLALGRPEEAAQIEEGLLADRLCVSGENHPHTLIARASLAASYQRAGRLAEAIALQEDVVAANERLLPADDPDVFPISATSRFPTEWPTAPPRP